MTYSEVPVEVQMDYNNKRVRMDERQHICSRPNSVCPPMSWTISNRLQQFSPFVLQWHYRSAHCCFSMSIALDCSSVVSCAFFGCIIVACALQHSNFDRACQ